MKELPEDGSLKEITAPAPALNPDHVIIIQRSEELTEPGETTYTLATFDRTREGVEWPGDRILEKLIPGLPKMKVPEVSKPEVMTKPNTTQHRHHLRRKFHQRPVQRNNNFITRRSRPPFKRFPYNRPEKPHNIDPWVHKPWENQAIFPGVNTATSFSATPLVSNMPFNDFGVQNSLTSHLFPPSTSSNNYNFPNNNERNRIPAAASNIQFLNSHMENINRPPPTTNRMPCILSFPPPDRFLNQCPANSDRGFSGPGTAPTQNMDFNSPNHNAGSLGEPPIPRFNGKPGLLGDSPFVNMPFNRNLATFPITISAQSDPEGSTATSLPRDQENIDDQNGFISNSKNSSMKKGSYDIGYKRNPRRNFDRYNDGNEISGQKSHDSYEYPQNTDDSRNNSFRDANEANYNRFHNSSSSVNHYEDQYRDSYNNLDCKLPNNNNNKNVKSLKNSRGSYKNNLERSKRPSAGVSHSKSGYMEVGNDNLRENSYNESRVSNVSKTSSFMNNQARNLAEESLIHISDSAVVYDEADFQNDGYPAAATNSAPRSNLNSASGSNIRRNSPTKNTLWTKRRGPTNKFGNNRLNKAKYNQFQGQQKFRNWRRP